MSAKRILLVCPPETGSNIRAEFLRGIADHVGPERCFRVHWGEPNAQELAELARWDPEGIIAYATASGIAAWGAHPRAVLVAYERLDHPRAVCLDEQAAGTLAADYLLGLGLPHLALIAANLDHPRCQSFVARLGGRCTVIDSKRAAGYPAGTAIFADALPTLPRPVGLFTFNDVGALHAAEAATSLALHIPNDVAILGADDDPVLCLLSPCPLSSVQIGHRDLGARAASLLEDLLNGRKATGPYLIAPRAVAVRRSTDIIAVEDPLVASALRFIRAHAMHPLRVTDVAKAVSSSRGTLLERFRACTGTTVSEAIQSAHLELAKRRLLAKPAQKLANVALDSGFGDRFQLTRAFRRRMGTSPLRWLRTNRGD